MGTGDSHEGRKGVRKIFLTSEGRIGENPYNITYQYDQGGNRIKMVENVNFGVDDVTTYTYDLENPTYYGSKDNRLMYSKKENVDAGSGSSSSSSMGPGPGETTTCASGSHVQAKPRCLGPPDDRALVAVLDVECWPGLIAHGMGIRA